jgi:hypothetical protein
VRLVHIDALAVSSTSMITPHLQTSLAFALWPELSPETFHWIALLPSSPLRVDYKDSSSSDISVVSNGVFWSGLPSRMFPSGNSSLFSG